MIQWGILVALWSGMALAEQAELTTTPRHRFYVTNRDVDNNGLLGEWVEAEDLRAGDQFLTADGRTARLKEKKESATANPRSPAAESKNRKGRNEGGSSLSSQTFNFSVADHHTYFVGEQGLWVHNAGRSCYYFDPRDMDALVMPGGKKTRSQILTMSDDDNLTDLFKLAGSGDGPLLAGRLTEISLDNYNLSLNPESRPSWKNLFRQGRRMFGAGSEASLMEEASFLVRGYGPDAFLELYPMDNFVKFASHPNIGYRNAGFIVLKKNKDFIYPLEHGGFNLGHYRPEVVEALSQVSDVPELLDNFRRKKIILSPRPLTMSDVHSFHMVHRTTGPVQYAEYTKIIFPMTD